jgi:hypothetical protein
MAIAKVEKMQGAVFDFDEPYCDVTEISLTKNRFYCKYLQGGYVYKIEVSSRDGITYRGNWGTPDLEDGFIVELTRFESKSKEIVLLGTWRDLINHNEGNYLVRLKS